MASAVRNIATRLARPAPGQRLIHRTLEIAVEGDQQMVERQTGIKAQIVGERPGDRRAQSQPQGISPAPADSGSAGPILAT